MSHSKVCKYDISSCARTLVFPVSRLNVPFVTISLNDCIHTLGLLLLAIIVRAHNVCVLRRLALAEVVKRLSAKRLLILPVSVCIRMTDDCAGLTTERFGTEPISVRGKGNASMEIAEKFEGFQLCRADSAGAAHPLVFGLKYEGDGSFSLEMPVNR